MIKTATIWFWQRMVTPHMALLAEALAARGIPVVYVANEQISAERAQQGWSAPTLIKAKLQIAPDEESIRVLVQSALPDSIHLCQGLRGNGLVTVAQQHLRAQGLRQWVMMETVDDVGWIGIIKRLSYRWLFWSLRNSLEGVLAIGSGTPNWVVARGMPPSKVFSFAYFLREPDMQEMQSIWAELPAERPFRFIFVGNLRELKRVDRLIRCIASLNDPNVDLWVVGSGPEELALKAQAAKLLPNRVSWLGRKNIDQVPSLIAEVDCLVLPSRHDGWGAVVSEALMVGTPAICSDACGSSIVVRASGTGGVFPAEDDQALLPVLRKQKDIGLQSLKRRQQLAKWATCLGAQCGADYMLQILSSNVDCVKRPLSPWDKQKCTIG